MKISLWKLLSISFTLSKAPALAFCRHHWQTNCGLLQVQPAKKDDIVCFTSSNSQAIRLCAANNMYEESDQDNPNTTDKILALPPIGESSSTEPFRAMNLNGKHTNSSESDSEKVPVAFVGSKKFEMQYTCNVCDTRNSNRVSRLGEFFFC